MASRQRICLVHCRDACGIPWRKKCKAYETYWTLEAAAEIYDRGVYVNPTLPPATPEGEALLRTSYMATHTEALLDEAMDIISDVMVKRHG